MPSCERVDVKAFHSETTQNYTAQAVNALARSETMRRYAHYSERREALYHASLVAPICLFVCFYADLVFGVTNDRALGQVVGSMVAMAPTRVAWALSAAMQGLILPWSMLAVFCGMFRDVPWEEARFVFGVVVLGRVLCNDALGSGLEPAIAVERVSAPPTAVMVALSVMASIVPTMGGLMVALIVHRWRSMHWERAVVVPLPMLTIPLLLGGVDVACRRYAGCALGTLASMAADTVPVLPACVSALEGVLHLVGADAAILIDVVVHGDAAPEDGGATATALAQAWRQSFFLGWVYICLMLLGSPLLDIAGWFRDRLIPTHPTTILVHLAVDAVLVALIGSAMTPFCWLAMGTHVYLLLSGDWSTE